METNSNNKRIAKNTLMLYVRMLFGMLVGLYTSRVVLEVLGVQDYGIYGVVGGIIAMMGFLNASMSIATSRFLTYEIGKDNQELLSKIFSSAIIVHVIIALIVLVVCETLGLWFLFNKLVIPASRMTAAFWVFQLSILSAMFNITQVPYNSCIVAHEKMDVYAYVEILNVTLKLLIVYLLLIGNFDKLILYAILMFAVSFIILMIYRTYCTRHFKECHLRLVLNKDIIVPLINFSVWNLYYEGSFAARQQGANFLLNIFCGVIYNAASSIATTVQGILLGFSSNLIMAFRPQVIKSYAQQNYDNMNRLIHMGTKFGLILILAITIPVLFEAEYLLGLWLVEVPAGSVFMVRCLLVVNVVNTASMLVVTGIQASGKIKLYSGLCGTIYIASIFIMYVCMRLDMDYHAIYVIILITSFVVNVCYSIILKKQVQSFEIIKFYSNAILPLALVVLIASVILSYLLQVMDNGLLQFVIFSCLAVVMILSMSLVMVFNKHERTAILNIICDKLHLQRK